MKRLFFDGEGTAKNPYRINSADDLRKLATDVNDGKSYEKIFFLLTADIKLDYEWTPIGYLISNDDNKTFKATFDGQGHTISNLQISSSGDCVGLFGGVGKGGTIKNLNLTNVNISGKDYVGGLVGGNCVGKIENCTVSNATVSGDGCVGGLVGENLDAEVENCTVSGATVSGDYFVGGLVGALFSNNKCSGKVMNCKVSSANISGNEDIGGLVGYNTDTVRNCIVNDTTVSGKVRVGGLVGKNGFGIDSEYNDIFGEVCKCEINNSTVSGNEDIDVLVGDIDCDWIFACKISETTVNGKNFENNEAQ